MSHRIGIEKKEKRIEEKKKNSIDLLGFLSKLFFDRLCFKKKKISIRFEFIIFKIFCINMFE